MCLEVSWSAYQPLRTPLHIITTNRMFVSADKHVLPVLDFGPELPQVLFLRHKVRKASLEFQTDTYLCHANSQELTACRESCSPQTYMPVG